MMIYILVVVVLIISVVVHEFFHGLMAFYLGDLTAKKSGRLSLNPLVHLDVLGSVVFPVLCLLIGGGVIYGWAKPVPVCASCFRNPYLGMRLVALSGPLGNICLVLCAIFASYIFDWLSMIDSVVMILLMLVIQINCVLALFNLIPCPPLDGGYLWPSFIIDRISAFQRRYPWVLWVFLGVLLMSGVLNDYYRFFIVPVVVFFQSFLKVF